MATKDNKDAKKKKNEAAKLSGKQYETELRRLQAELCHLQAWVKAKGLRVIVVFEGRDGAGKGGTIRAITERVSPRVFRVVALPAPSDREKSQMYMQRYMQHFPAAGEIVIFDRSWYNRAGVERVMGFCTKDQYEQFLELCPAVEQYIIDGGIILLKYWLEVSNEEQERRFAARIQDPLRQWKLSAMDLPSRARWYDYSSGPRQNARCHRLKHMLRGTSCHPTIRNAHASTASRICSARSPTKSFRARRFNYPSGRKKAHTTIKPRWLKGGSYRRNSDGTTRKLLVGKFGRF